jgi:hypothetical protein
VTDRRTKRRGAIYLLHFDPPFKHAGHYLGFVASGSPEKLEERIAQHLAGDGSPLVRAAVAAGSTVRHIVTLWGRTRDDERRLKNGGSSARFCPLCKAKHNARAAERMRRVRAREAS